MTKTAKYVPTSYQHSLSRQDWGLAILMPLLANGPTVVPEIGLRSEHVSVVIFAVISLFQIRFRVFPPIAQALVVVGMFFFFSAFNADLFPSFIFIKEEFNVAKFPLVFIPLCYLFSATEHNLRFKYLKRAMCVYFIVVLMNLTLQLANMQGYALTIPMYFAGDGETASVLWQACYGQGRYTGVFLQPANQGFFTGLFLITAMWVWERQTFKWFVLIVASLSIFLGASKVGLVGILLAGAFLLRKRPAYIIPLVVVAFVFFYFLGWAKSTGVTGLELQFLDSGKEKSLESLTAGRFGEGSTLFYAMSCVWNSNPVLGVGAGELLRVFSMPYDNDFVYVYANGGIFAVLAELGAFLAILAFAKGEWKYHVLSLLGFMAISSLGIVVFSGNGSIFLLAVVLSFFYAESRSINTRVKGLPNV